MSGYYMIKRKGHSDSPIICWFSVMVFLILQLMFPGQIFSAPYALITDQGNATTPGRVVVINLDKKTVAETIDVGISPEGIVVDDVNGLAYVANSGSDSVSVIEINPPNSSIVETITGYFDTPLNLTITPDNRYVFVTNTGMGNNYGITAIDTTTNAVVMTGPPISTGYLEPNGIDICGGYVCVSYPNEFVIRVLDIDITNTNYNLIWETSTSPDRPGRLTAIPSFVYAITDSTVSKIGDDNYYSSLPSSYFNSPENLAMHPNGIDLYVTNKGDNSVTVIHTDYDEQTARINVGIGTSPSGISFDPFGSHAYVANSGNGTISIIDTTTKSIIGSISDPALITPIDIAIIEGPDNLPPYEPKIPFPTDGEMGVAVSTHLSWEGGDPDYPNDTVTYDVYLGTDPEMGLGQVCTGIVHPDTFCTPSISPLEYGTTYYWMVAATDYYGETSEVPYPYWSFTTEGGVPSYEVTITPDSATANFGETVQFSASTTFNGEIISGDYIWDLTSSLGSIIDENGLYTAGTVEGIDIVTVIDIAHEDITDAALVTVASSGPPCEVIIAPPSAIVSSGETIAFSATTNPVPPNTECNEGAYLWSVDSPIESSITQDGLYTAGSNNTGEDVTDIVTVTDMANGNITNVAEVKVVAEGEYIVVITPEEKTLASLTSCRFTAQTMDAETNIPVPEEECTYRWEISPPSIIRSTISTNGLYVAGLNHNGKLITETVIVSDTAHNNASAAATVTVLVKNTSIPYFLLPPGPLLTNYRMISVGPIWPVDGDALRIITGGTEYNPYLIRLFRWDGQLDEGQGGYREYPDIPKLEPGIGIWAIILSGGFLLVDGTPVDTSQAFTITLPPGWTQIGNPFPFTVDWNQVSIPGNDVETPWTFVGSYLPSPFLRPWHGYFVYNNSLSPVTISIPPLESGVESSKTRTPLSKNEEGFQLQIGVHNIPFFWLKDTYNFIGLSEESSAEHDLKDIHEPPPISLDQLSCYFPHEREGKLERYTSDFRSLDSEREVFECRVNPGSGIISLMRLFWSDTERVPQEYQLEFIDPKTGITLNMREVNEYWFFSYLGVDKHFKITMSKIPH